MNLAQTYSRKPVREEGVCASHSSLPSRFSLKTAIDRPAPRVAVVMPMPPPRACGISLGERRAPMIFAGGGLPLNMLSLSARWGDFKREASGDGLPAGY